MKNKYYFLLIALVALLLISFELGWITFHRNSQINQYVKITISNILIGSLFIFFMIQLGHKKIFRFTPITALTWITIIPAIIISINNFPISAFIQDHTYMTLPNNHIFPFIIYNSSIAFFEEIIFRSILLVLFLKTMPQTKKSVFKAIIYSSIVFALVHILNYFEGASIFNTLRQVGYSFLTGLLWSSLYLLTKNLYISMFAHATYNIAGMFFVSLGYVINQFDTVTIVVTILLSTLTALYYLNLIYKSDTAELYEILP